MYCERTISNAAGAFEKSDRRTDTGIGRNDDPADPELLREPAGMQRRRATERNQRPLRISTPRSTAWTRAALTMFSSTTSRRRRPP